jgi:hypothetical protein
MTVFKGESISAASLTKLQYLVTLIAKSLDSCYRFVYNDTKLLAYYH